MELDRMKQEAHVVAINDVSIHITVFSLKELTGPVQR